MPVTYNTIEMVEECHIPSFDIYWPASAGCSPRHVYDVARNVTCPTNQVAYYEPESVQETKDRRRLRGIRRGYPPYAMTPYYRSRVTTRKFLLRRRNATNGQDAYRQYGRVDRIGTTCVPVLERTEHLGPFTAEWTEVTDYNGGMEYIVNGFNAAKIDDARRKLIEDVSNKAREASYDVLTDIAEAREIPDLLRSISTDLIKVLRMMQGRFSLADLRQAAFIAPLDLIRHPKKALRRLGDNWMRYRYGIMPLIYSYRDLLKTINRGIDVRDKSSAGFQPEPTGVTLPGPTIVYKRTETMGDIRLRASVFQHFDWEGAAQYAGIGVNPLVTAWELIPYSFVVDWFVNVGDYIASNTSNSAAQMSFACVSRRDNYVKTTYVHFKNEDKYVTFTLCPCTPWLGAMPPSAPSRLISRPEEEQPYQQTEVQSYTRETFALNGAKLSFNPNLNWKRLLDGAVMSLNQLGKLSSFLKG